MSRDFEGNHGAFRRGNEGNVMRVHVINGLEMSEGLVCALKRFAQKDGVSLYQAIRNAVGMYISARE